MNASQKQRLVRRMQQLGYGKRAAERVLETTASKAEKSTGFVHVSDVEDACMRTLHEQGLGVKKIAAALKRSTDTVSTLTKPYSPFFRLGDCVIHCFNCRNT